LGGGQKCQSDEKGGVKKTSRRRGTRDEHQKNWENPTKGGKEAYPDIFTGRESMAQKVRKGKKMKTSLTKHQQRRGAEREKKGGGILSFVMKQERRYRTRKGGGNDRRKKKRTS